MKPFVKVIWHDAADEDRTWLKEADVKEFGEEPCEVVSWGWLVSKTPKYLTLAADFIPGTDTFGRVCKIPNGMLVSCEEFKQE